MKKDSTNEAEIASTENSAPPDEREELRIEQRFAEIRQIYGSVEENRLRDLYSIRIKPINAEGKIQRLRGDEIKELVKFGIIKSQLEETGDIANDSACAEFIRKNFSYPCNRDDISKWRKGKHLPLGAKPFPMKDGAGRTKAVELESWCRAHLAVGDEHSEPAIGGMPKKDPRLIREEAEARMAQRRDLREEREFSEEWMLSAQVENGVLGLAARLDGLFFKPYYDRNGLAKLVCDFLQSAGASEELLAKCKSDLPPILSADGEKLKAECARLAEDTVKGFKTDRKDQLKKQEKL